MAQTPIPQEFSSLFTPQSMYKAIVQMNTPMTFLRKMFFPTRKDELFATRTITYTFKNKKRRIAPFSLRNSTGPKVQNDKTEAFIMEPPYLKPRRDIEPDDINQIMEGGNPFESVSPGQKFAELRNERLLDNEMDVQRTEEYMIQQALYNQEVKVLGEKGKQISKKIVYTKRNTALDAGVDWSNTSTADPFKDVRDKRTLITRYSGGLPVTNAVLGTDAADQMLNCAKVQDYLRADSYAVSRLEQKLDPTNFGALYMFTVNGIDYWRLDEYQINPATNQEENFIPTDSLLLGSAMGENFFAYGGIQTLGINNTFKAKRFPKFYDESDKDPELYGVQLQSAPLPIIGQPNGFSVSTVTTGA
jgi:hypothetical protein